MKKFLVGLCVLCEVSLPSYSKEYRLNVDTVKPMGCKTCEQG